MNTSRLDRFTRTLSTAPSRRVVLRSFVATVLGLLPVRSPGVVQARELKRNKYGCVNVGNPCRGRDSVCCSGRCKGKRPRSGERDKSRCVAHDASTCEAGQRAFDCGGMAPQCTTTAGFQGQCNTTTGNAAFCTNEWICMPCRKDAECREACGAAAACIKCPNCSGTTFETACTGPGGCVPPNESPWPGRRSAGE